MTYTKHPKSIIVIHWLTFVLFAVALIFFRPKTKDLEIRNNIQFFYVQLSFGIIILLLTIIRIFVKRKYSDQRPPNIKYFKPVHKKIAKVVYPFIYILLIFIPLVSLTISYQINTLSSEFTHSLSNEIDFYNNLILVHKISIFSILLLITIHVGYLLYYMIKTKENVFKRIFF